jgi:beta-glucosidase
VTVYDSDFIKQRPITNLDLRAQGGVTYRYFQGQPLWPFGFGMSYGVFEFKPTAPNAILKTNVSTASSSHRNDALCFSVTVSAAEGGLESDVAVLGFLQPQHQSAIDVITKKLPNPQLCDFTRLAAVKPGSERKVSLCVDGLGPGLEHVSEDGSKTVLPGEYVMTVGVKSEGNVGGTGAGAVIGRVLVSA